MIDCFFGNDSRCPCFFGNLIYVPLTEKFLFDAFFHKCAIKPAGSVTYFTVSNRLVRLSYEVLLSKANTDEFTCGKFVYALNPDDQSDPICNPQQKPL